MSFDPFDPLPSPLPKPPTPQKPTSYVAWVLLALVAGWVVYDRLYLRPDSGPTSEQASGRAFGKALSLAYADSLDVYVQKIHENASEQDAMTALSSRWAELRTARHREIVQPVLKAIRPEGSEFTDPSQKTRYLDAIRGIQQGLRDVR